MQYSQSKIKKCLKAGKLNMEHIDRAVKNIVGVLIRQVPKIKPRPMELVGCAEHRSLAREIAQKGMVLLKNDNALPLKPTDTLFAGGPSANEVNVGDFGSSRVFDKQVATPYAALQKEFGNVSLQQADGQVAVLFVGSNRKEEGEYFANLKYSMQEKPKDCGGDRASLRLSAEEVALIKGCKQAGKKVVVVLYSGAAIITEDWKQYADAIVMQYYSGCEGATALAELLVGKANFSGKLPFTVAKTEQDYPAMIGIGEKPYVIEYGYYHGYTLLDHEGKQAEYPFGFGLSYTRFDIESFAVEQDEKTLYVKVAVKNTGERDGAEVVQVYAGSTAKDKERPHKLLKGFKRVELAAGSSQTVTLAVEKDDLRFYENGQWLLDEAYTIYAGSSSEECEKHNTTVAM